MSWVGIDPGIHGAVACLDDAGQVEDIFDMPIKERGFRNKKAKHVVDGFMLGGILSAWHDDTPLRVTMEQVNSFGGMGAVSAFTFGQTFGTIEGVLSGLDIGYMLVTPQMWKKHYGLKGGRDHKDEALELARERWPDTDWFKRKKDTDRAEAALIAAYALETRSG